ncbi:hypothetical protein Ddc_02815 [Ditylenchus destructor]|nr:hypothetical protein Ddc_02815 [Ditylenchus destructor]
MFIQKSQVPLKEFQDDIREWYARYSQQFTSANYRDYLTEREQHSKLEDAFERLEVETESECRRKEIEVAQKLQNAIIQKPQKSEVTVHPGPLIQQAVPHLPIDKAGLKHKVSSEKPYTLPQRNSIVDNVKAIYFEPILEIQPEDFLLLSSDSESDFDELSQEQQEFDTEYKEPLHLENKRELGSKFNKDVPVGLQSKDGTFAQTTDSLNVVPSSLTNKEQANPSLTFQLNTASVLKPSMSSGQTIQPNSLVSSKSDQVVTSPNNFQASPNNFQFKNDVTTTQPNVDERNKQILSPPTNSTPFTFRYNKDAVPMTSTPDDPKTVPFSIKPDDFSFAKICSPDSVKTNTSSESSPFKSVIPDKQPAQGREPQECLNDDFLGGCHLAKWIKFYAADHEKLKAEINAFEKNTDLKKARITLKKMIIDKINFSAKKKATNSDLAHALSFFMDLFDFKPVKDSNDEEFQLDQSNKPMINYAMSTICSRFIDKVKWDAELTDSIIMIVVTLCLRSTQFYKIFCAEILSFSTMLSLSVSRILDKVISFGSATPEAPTHWLETESAIFGLFYKVHFRLKSAKEYTTDAPQNVKGPELIRMIFVSTLQLENPVLLSSAFLATEILNDSTKSGIAAIGGKV